MVQWLRLCASTAGGVGSVPTLGQLEGSDKGITTKKRVGKRNAVEAKNNNSKHFFEHLLHGKPCLKFHLKVSLI